jgi:thousand and one amino acid protein kinase
MDRKAFESQKKKEYKANKERWKRELSLDETTPKRQRDATLQCVYFYLNGANEIYIVVVTV